MKKSLLYSFFVCFCLIMQSCLFSEDDLFDKSSAQREISAEKELSEILESAPNGWLMKFYTTYGGINVIAEFKDGKVTMTSEEGGEDADTGDLVSSTFKIDYCQGTQLSFDTYNDIIHYLCQRVDFYNPGYEGDYEFIVRSMSKEKIVLSGKKYNMSLVMTPMPKDSKWNDYLDKVIDIQEKAYLGTYSLYVNDKKVINVKQSFNSFSIIKEDGLDTDEEVYPFIYTDKGISLYDSVSFDNVMVKNFVWDNESMAYVCSDEGTNVKLQSYYPEGYLRYDDILGSYTMISGQDSYDVEIEEIDHNGSFLIEGFEVPLEAEYNIKTGSFEIDYQFVAMLEENYYLFLCPWDTNAGYFTWQSGSGMVSKVESVSPLRISFVDNGVFGTADSFLVYAFSSDKPSGSSAIRALSRLIKPVLIKK